MLLARRTLRLAQHRCFTAPRPPPLATTPCFTTAAGYPVGVDFGTPSSEQALDGQELRQG